MHEPMDATRRMEEIRQQENMKRLMNLAFIDKNELASLRDGYAAALAQLSIADRLAEAVFRTHGGHPKIGPLATEYMEGKGK
jgi:hypothetical protein